MRLCHDGCNLAKTYRVYASTLWHTIKYEYVIRLKKKGMLQHTCIRLFFFFNNNCWIKMLWRNISVPSLKVQNRTEMCMNTKRCNLLLPFCFSLHEVWCKCAAYSWGSRGLTPLAVADVKNHAVKNVRLTQRGTLANPDYRSTFIY